MTPEFRQAVFNAGFKPTRETNEFCNVLKNRLGFQYNYEAARLCLGRSLGQAGAVAPIASGRESAPPIRGQNLFGADDLDLWICLIVEAGNLGPGASVNDFRVAVEAHWERGAVMLREEWETSKHDDIEFLLALGAHLPDAPSSATGRKAGVRAAGPLGAITVPVGEVSQTHPGNEPVTLTVNGEGSSPHIALMGRNGSGKTRTGILLASNIIKAANIPILILDPKGDFVEDGRVKSHIADLFPGIQAIELGSEPVPLDFLPPPSIGNTQVTQAAMHFRDALVGCFRMSGPIQQENLRQAVEAVIHGGGPRDLAAIRDEYHDNLVRTGAQEMDAVLSKLNELTALELFDPEHSAPEFFGRSWVVGMSTLKAEEVKRLSILLILNALAAHVLSSPDSDSRNGFRRLRHLLFIDEARRILTDTKNRSLEDLLRQSRSKGQVVMLISQDPSDFQGRDDDFTGQLGAVVAFTCTAHRGLKALQGAYGRKLQPAEFGDSQLPQGVAFAKLPFRQPERIRTWAPS